MEEMTSPRLTFGNFPEPKLPHTWSTLTKAEEDARAMTEASFQACKAFTRTLERIKPLLPPSSEKDFPDASDLRVTLEETSKAVQMLQAKVGSHWQGVKVVQRTMELMAQEVSAKFEECKEGGEVLVGLRRKLTEANQTIRSLEARVSDLEDEVKKSNSRVTDLEDEVRKSEDRVNALEDQVKKGREERERDRQQRNQDRRLLDLLLEDSKQDRQRVMLGELAYLMDAAARLYVYEGQASPFINIVEMSALYKEGKLTASQRQRWEVFSAFLAEQNWSVLEVGFVTRQLRAIRSGVAHGKSCEAESVTTEDLLQWGEEFLRYDEVTSYKRFVKLVGHFGNPARPLVISKLEDIRRVVESTVQGRS